MDETLQTGLHEGETVLWQSRCEPIQTLDRTNKKRFWTTLIICAAVFATLCILYLKNINMLPKPSVFVILLVACGFAPLQRLTDARKARRLRYAVTDQRLLTVSGELIGVELSRVTKLALRQDDDGHLSLLAGERAIKAKPNRWRDLALTGQPFSPDEEKEPVERFVFYAVEDRKGLERVLEQVLPQADKE